MLAMPDVGGLAAVKAGAAGAGVTVMVMGAVTASGMAPLLARTVNGVDHAAVGVPDTVPVVESRLKPGGRVPLAIVKVGAGVPVATKVYGP